MSPLPLLLAAACAPTDGWVRVRILEDPSDGIGGPKALGAAGDILIENDRIRAVILQGGYSMGPGVWGGSLVDLDLQRLGSLGVGGQGNDLLAEVIPTVNLNVSEAVEPDDVTVLADGSDGGPAVVRVRAPAAPFLRLLGAVWLVLETGGVDVPDLELVTDYELRPGEPFLRVTTTATVLGDGATAQEEGEPIPPREDGFDVIGTALGGGLVFGDYYLQGGSVDAFVPGYGFDENLAVYEATLEGRNLLSDPFVLPYLGGAGAGTSYAIGPLEGNVYVPLFTSSQTAAVGGAVDAPQDCADTGCTDESFAPGTAFTYRRAIGVGYGDTASAWAALLEAQGVPTGRVTGHVVEETTGSPVSGARVFVYAPGAEAPITEWTTDVALDDTTPDGSFGGPLPAGSWELLVHETGRPTGRRVPIEVAEGEEIDISLTALRTGEVTFEVEDETGLAVPAKVTVVPADGPSTRDPVLGDGFIGGDPEAVVFLAHGSGSTYLPPGDYIAYASRGPEYELGEARFVVEVARPQRVRLQVVRSVDTSGWVSADFHVHSFPSHDSGVTAPERVASMAAENVEFMVSSDHDWITDFRPTIEDMDLERFISTAPGVEVTPIEFGHYIGFPLEADTVARSGGAFDWSLLTPEEIIDELRAAGPSPEDVATLVAHPRDGILGYFDQFGLDPYAGQPGMPVVDVPITNVFSDPNYFTSGNFTLDFDALEIMGTKRLDLIRTPTAPEQEALASDPDFDPYRFIERTLEEQADLQDGTYTLAYGVEGQVDDWFTLLNLGYRLTALANSDTHGRTKVEAGCPRNFVMSDTDDPAYIDPVAIAHAVKEHRVVASYGPFVRVWAQGDPDLGIGSEIVASGPVDLTIEVQSPTWFDVGRVELYENGTLVDAWELETPNPDVLDFYETVTVQPDRDAWYVVIASGNDSLFPLYTPVEIPPIQLQDIVTDALSSSDIFASLLAEPIPIPDTHPVHPFAVTNPIWVDRDGDGFDPPGLPAWLVAPAAPDE